ncbi:unnamed protein product [Spodoptera exigua]|nr:unnamed protein product [Spodoptera exigua]
MGIMRKSVVNYLIRRKKVVHDISPRISIFVILSLSNDFTDESNKKKLICHRPHTLLFVGVACLVTNQRRAHVYEPINLSNLVHIHSYAAVKPTDQRYPNFIFMYKMSSNIVSLDMIV